MRLLATAVAVVMLGAGCGAGDDPTVDSTTTTPPTTAPSTTGAVQLECSAFSLPPVPAQQQLPAAVAATRLEIANAAITCDYDELGRLAAAGDASFTFSFGGEPDAAAFWEQREGAGDAVLRVLHQLLALPPTSRGEGTDRQWLWPRAFAYDRWSDVPQPARDELREIYGADDINQWERAGSYLGHRVGISTDGEWLFFVAGD